MPQTFEQNLNCLLPTLQFPSDMPGEVDLSEMPKSLRPPSQPTAVNPNEIQKSYCRRVQTLLTRIRATTIVVYELLFAQNFHLPYR